MKRIVLTAMTAVSLAVPAGAQGPAERQLVEQTASLKREIEVGQVAAMAVQSRITPGAPYSAEAVTESTQALADGNRIARKTIARIYRDTEGRTRREEVDAETGAVRTVSISDPVAHSTFTLDPATRTARRANVFIATPAAIAEGGGRGGRGGVIAAGSVVAVAPNGIAATDKAAAEKLAVEGRARAEGVAIAPLPMPAQAGGGGRMSRVPADGSQTTREDLGQQTIEGVPATGQRTTTTIPAGAIGNIQPIKVVSEQWTSVDLKVLVLTKHSDPRSGETTYRLVNIVRAEPDRSLFSVPADYTIKDQLIRQQNQ